MNVHRYGVGRHWLWAEVTWDATEKPNGVHKHDWPRQVEPHNLQHGTSEHIVNTQWIVAKRNERERERKDASKKLDCNSHTKRCDLSRTNECIHINESFRSICFCGHTIFTFQLLVCALRLALLGRMQLIVHHHVSLLVPALRELWPIPVYAPTCTGLLC